MGDIEDKLRARLGAGNTTTGQLPGSTPRALPGEVAQRLEDRAVRETYAPMTVYFVFDTTNSMQLYIDAVRNCANVVGNAILSAEKGIEATVWGVGEHDRVAGEEYARHRKQSFARTGG